MARDWDLGDKPTFLLTLCPWSILVTKHSPSKGSLDCHPQGTTGPPTQASYLNLPLSYIVSHFLSLYFSLSSLQPLLISCQYPYYFWFLSVLIELYLTPLTFHRWGTLYVASVSKCSFHFWPVVVLQGCPMTPQFSRCNSKDVSSCKFEPTTRTIRMSNNSNHL